MTERELHLRRLHRDRPRSRFARRSAWLLLLMMVGSWWIGGFDPSELLTPRRLENLQRFLVELRPYPLQGAEFDWGRAGAWALQLMRERGFAAALTTLAIAVAAIVLAALAGLLLSLPAARNLALPEPFAPLATQGRPVSRLLWGALVLGTRLLLIFARSIPEYVWAFLFVALLGPSAWPAVLALALHNAGILGRLGAEVIENLDHRPLWALRSLGASRAQLALAGLFPLTFSRFLLFFFYRWETCVREATVLGMLGIISLGFWIQDARARNHYDEMFFLILLGSLLVLLGDLLSALAREFLRRHG